MKLDDVIDLLEETAFDLGFNLQFKMQKGQPAIIGSHLSETGYVCFEFEEFQRHTKDESEYFTWLIKGRLAGAYLRISQKSLKTAKGLLDSDAPDETGCVEE
jgi:hypothetical protein